MSFFVKINSFSNIFDLNRKILPSFKRRREIFCEKKWWIRRFGIRKNMSRNVNTYLQIKHAYFERYGMFQGLSYRQMCISSKSILNSMRSDFSYQYYFIDFSFKENSDKNPCRVYINLNCNVTYQLKLTTMNFLLTNQSQSWIQNLTFLLIRKLQNQICGKN